MSHKFLLLDTTYAVSSYALAEEGKGVVALRHHAEAQEQAAVINNMIDTLLKEASWSCRDLSAVIICSGPGSYTGMRISYSVAKGLCYGLELPLVAVDRLSVLAYGKPGVSLVALYARTGEYFAGICRDAEWLVAPRHCEENALPRYVQQLAPQRLITDRVPAIWQDAYPLEVEQLDLLQPLNMDFLYMLGREKYRAGSYEDIAYSEPLYLKPVYTTVPGKKSIL
ncbi:MAG: tRNA (adenosine(37)-N6)-threonylcarbamoyltransferase complex dimerization subunit type 1 TsaB [Bacteroidetes bacterium 47-18]|nr:MAG: tRNA (adenosine(37)-N6)-threonylcarbamoyltransferase complex dimerization subunit type 1 TsaB [Bacteroidetes bacterium 47-18]